MADSTFSDLLVHSVESASVIEQSVLLLLLLMSKMSWAIILLKLHQLRQLAANHRHFMQALSMATHSGEVTVASRPGPSMMDQIFMTGLATWQQCRSPVNIATPPPVGHVFLGTGGPPDNAVRLAMEEALARELASLNRHLSLLATTGSAAPFIGLFGTVWGIMATFQVLGSMKSANLQILAPPIAAALIATAAGLAVAIPAVVAFNAITARIDEEHVATENLLNRLVHHFSRSGGSLPSPAEKA
jgi:biopolymer transport protein TolQ